MSRADGMIRFNRNKLKGDEPIIGNRTFLNVTLTSDTFFDGRRLPVPSGLGSDSAGSQEFFGRFGQYFMSENMAFSIALFHGDTSFRPIDWQIKFTPELNINYLPVQENGIVNVDVRKGDTRLDTHLGLAGSFRRSQAQGPEHALRFRFGSRRHSDLSLAISAASFFRSGAGNPDLRDAWIPTAISTTSPISPCSKRTLTAD